MASFESSALDFFDLRAHSVTSALVLERCTHIQDTRRRHHGHARHSRAGPVGSFTARHLQRQARRRRRLTPGGAERRPISTVAVDALDTDSLTACAKGRDRLQRLQPAVHAVAELWPPLATSILTARALGRCPRHMSNLYGYRIDGRSPSPPARPGPRQGMIARACGRALAAQRSGTIPRRRGARCGLLRTEVVGSSSATPCRLSSPARPPGSSAADMVHSFTYIDDVGVRWRCSARPRATTASGTCRRTRH